MLDICGAQAIYLPSISCNDCEALAQRVTNLERKLKGKSDVELSKTDSVGTVSVTVIGSVSEG